MTNQIGIKYISLIFSTFESQELVGGRWIRPKGSMVSKITAGCGLNFLRETGSTHLIGRPLLILCVARKNRMWPYKSEIEKRFEI